MDSRFQPTADLVNALSYEAPCVEMVLHAEDLEREIYYAGSITCGCEDDPWTNIPD